MAHKIIAVERGKRKMSDAMLGNILRNCHRKKFEIDAVKLND